jgi:site-specific recombinase XerD
MTETDLRAGEGARALDFRPRCRPRWRLLYGSGLRISEALSLTPPTCAGCRENGALTRSIGKGRQDTAGAGAAAILRLDGRLCRRSALTTCRATGRCSSARAAAR